MYHCNNIIIEAEKPPKPQLAILLQVIFFSSFSSVLPEKQYLLSYLSWFTSNTPLSIMYAYNLFAKGHSYACTALFSCSWLINHIKMLQWFFLISLFSIPQPLSWMKTVYPFSVFILKGNYSLTWNGFSAIIDNIHKQGLSKSSFPRITAGSTDILNLILCSLSICSTVFQCH